jgi:(4S)-4-hydroxy-5-phosphonooxypentane-2,3-dione isomerase
MPHSLSIIHVHVRVKPDFVDAFHIATLANATASVREPGIARFDVMQDADDRTQFVLTELYRSEDAMLAHRETAHYKTWRDTVADWMAEPRTRRRFVNVFPDDSGF